MIEFSPIVREVWQSRNTDPCAGCEVRACREGDELKDLFVTEIFHDRLERNEGVLEGIYSGVLPYEMKRVQPKVEKAAVDLSDSTVESIANLGHRALMALDGLQPDDYARLATCVSNCLEGNCAEYPLFSMLEDIAELRINQRGQNAYAISFV